eukprot:1740283-Lingulodinium_polyedra.AAC.1
MATSSSRVARRARATLSTTWGPTPLARNARSSTYARRATMDSSRPNARPHGTSTARDTSTANAQP